MSRAHGTRAKYVADKCRCHACVQANRDYARARDRASRRPDEISRSAFVSAAPVRAHLHELSAAGVGYKRAAEISGVGKTALFKVLNGHSKRMLRANAERVLAVTPAAVADGAYIDAAPTWELINQLLAAGWSKAAISRAIGQDGLALQLGKTRVTAAHARAIADLAARELTEPDRDRNARAIAATDEFERLYATLAQIVEDRQEPWRRHAACAPPAITPDVFYVGRGESVDPARELCARCPVATQCAAAGAHEREGVWGGITPKERRSQLEEVA